jgi:hypothetical protein
MIARLIVGPLDKIQPANDQQEQWLSLYKKAMLELMQGHEREAIALYEQAAAGFDRIQKSLPIGVANEFVFQFGVAHLRLGETQNCCSRKHPDNCLLPIRGGGIHMRTEGSRRAIEIFSQLMRLTPQNSILHLRAQWLTNIAYMTLGEFPDKVPLDILLPPAAFESQEPFPRFNNIAQQLGLDQFNMAGGVVADDFDNDGYIDLLVSVFDLSAQMRYYHNNQDGTFTDQTEAARLMGITGGSNMSQADYNNDGFVDVYVMRGGWLGAAGRHPISLLRNNGNGTFTDVTFDAGLGNEFYPCQSGGWADYDNDGLVDLYVGGEYVGDWTDAKPTCAPCRLFHNNGDGTFTDVAPEAGVVNDRFTKATSWGDYDGDGYPDLYVSNFGMPNRLYHNNGNGTFTDVAQQLRVTGPSHSFPCWFWDFDNDGVLDLYVSAYAAGTEHLAADCLNMHDNVEMACLYRGDGLGGFNNVAREFNLLRPNAPMSGNFGDLDNDGYLDFYLGTGNPLYSNLMPNVMYHNQQGKRFADVTTAGGFGNLQKGHGIAFADFDNDGDQDIFTQMGGAIAGDKYYNSFYENPGFKRHWLGIQLRGVQSNRSAIGARLRVVITENGEQRSIYRHVNSGGSFGASPMRQMIGLGDARQIDRLEIHWPTSGKTDIYRDIPGDQQIRIVEGDTQFSVVPLKTFTLGPKAL